MGDDDYYGGDVDDGDGGDAGAFRLLFFGLSTRALYVEMVVVVPLLLVMLSLWRWW
jgi:hypothetical protein